MADRAAPRPAGPARAELDRWLPPRGPCLVCGVPGMDARHRVIDAICDHAEAGDAAADIADELGLPLEAVLAALAWSAENLLPGHADQVHEGESRAARG